MPDYPYMNEAERSAKYRDNYLKSKAKPERPDTTPLSNTEELNNMLIEVRHGRMSNTKAMQIIDNLATERAIEARLNEAFLIGVKQEKGEYLPATYLINRKNELRATLKANRNTQKGEK